MRKYLWVGIPIILILVLAGCVSKDVLLPPMALQTEIFQKQTNTLTTVLDAYDKLVTKIVNQYYAEDIARKEIALTDAEGRVKLTEYKTLLNSVKTELDKELSALRQKRSEFELALTMNRDAYLALDSKLREYMGKGTLTSNDINRLISEMVQIYEKLKTR